MSITMGLWLVRDTDYMDTKQLINSSDFTSIGDIDQ